jgi:glycosyltransferase involved in cell wall biosynthesis
LAPVPPNVEVIIFDDTTNYDVKKVADKYPSRNITYQKNAAAKGAIANWNSLLDSAQGEFVMLLHHDELPLGDDFLKHLLATLQDTSNDVLVMNVRLLDPTMSSIRRHVPGALRDFVIRWVPGYFFCRNVIGPTAALIVRRTAYPKFDAQLKWLVDVDMYYRLRNTTKRWQTIRDVEIGSVQGDNTSITQTLQNDLKQLEQIERLQLSAQYPEASFWINLKQKPLVGTLEAIAWGSFRVIQIALSSVRKRKGPLK